jgi:hypothetical protein
MSCRRGRQFKPRAILVTTPDFAKVSVFTVADNGKLMNQQPLVFHDPGVKPSWKRKESPLPQFKCSSENGENAIHCEPTELGLWTTLFDDDLSHGIAVDDFLCVIESRKGIDSVF